MFTGWRSERSTFSKHGFGLRNTKENDKLESEGAEARKGGKGRMLDYQSPWEYRRVFLCRCQQDPQRVK